MANIALAGGTGALGQTILAFLAASPVQHNIHILTRQPISDLTPSSTTPPPTPKPLQSPSPSNKITPSPGPNLNPQSTIHYHTTTYTLANLTSLLTKHSIKIIISALDIDSAAASESQKILIQAAYSCATVTHVLPSEYCFLSSPELRELHPMWKHWEENSLLLNNLSRGDTTVTGTGTGFIYTRLITGFFMDYWGQPYLQSYLRPFPWAVDVNRMLAAVPESGGSLDGSTDARKTKKKNKKHARIAMTWTGDVARFIAQVLVPDALGLGIGAKGARSGAAAAAAAAAADGGGGGGDGNEKWTEPPTKALEGSSYWNAEVTYLVSDTTTFPSLIDAIEKARNRKFNRIVYDSPEKLDDPKQGATVLSISDLPLAVGAEAGQVGDIDNHNHDANNENLALDLKEYFTVFSRMVIRDLMDVEMQETLRAEKEQTGQDGKPQARSKDRLKTRWVSPQELDWEMLTVRDMVEWCWKGR